MTNRLLKLPEVIAITGKSRSSIYASIRSGEFVVPVKIGKRSIAFPESEIYAWVDSRISEFRTQEVGS